MPRSVPANHEHITRSQTKFRDDRLSDAHALRIVLIYSQRVDAGQTQHADSLPVFGLLTGPSIPNVKTSLRKGATRPVVSNNRVDDRALERANLDTRLSS